MGRLRFAAATRSTSLTYRSANFSGVIPFEPRGIDLCSGSPSNFGNTAGRCQRRRKSQSMVADFAGMASNTGVRARNRLVRLAPLRLEITALGVFDVDLDALALEVSLVGAAHGTLKAFEIDIAEK